MELKLTSMKGKGRTFAQRKDFEIRTISLYMGDRLSLWEDCGYCTNRVELRERFVHSAYVLKFRFSLDTLRFIANIIIQ